MPSKKTRWRSAFLRALAGSGNVRVAAREAGVDPGTAYDWRVKDAGFAARWEVAKGKAAARRPLHQPSAGPPPRSGADLVLRRTRRGDQLVRAAAGRWSRALEARFLEALRESGCVQTAADAVGLSTTALYKRRDRYDEFAEAWAAAEAAARERLPGMLFAASLASMDPAAEPARPRGRRRAIKVNVDQAIRINAIEERRQRTAAGPGRRGGIRPRTASNAEVREALGKALAAFSKRIDEEQVAAGWTRLDDGTMIPPGWIYVGVG